jgi:phage terminase large subunit-like protein
VAAKEDAANNRERRNVFMWREWSVAGGRGNGRTENGKLRRENGRTRAFEV